MRCDAIRINKRVSTGKEQSDRFSSHSPQSSPPAPSSVLPYPHSYYEQIISSRHHSTVTSFPPLPSYFFLAPTMCHVVGLCRVGTWRVLSCSCFLAFFSFLPFFHYSGGGFFFLSSSFLLPPSFSHSNYSSRSTLPSSLPFAPLSQSSNPQI